jgi:hypothetical protein
MIFSQNEIHFISVPYNQDCRSDLENDFASTTPRPTVDACTFLLHSVQRHFTKNNVCFLDAPSLEHVHK